MSAKKDKDAKTMKKVLQLIGERDESIRQAFTQFDAKVGQGFNAMEMKLAVAFQALHSLGITEEQLKAISEAVQQQASGGDQNEQSSTPTPTDDKAITKPEVACNENGDEHFG